MTQTWTSAEAFENDLLAFSEIEGARENVEPTIPQSLLEWEAQNGVHHESIYITPDLSEDVAYIVSGRGRGGVSTIFRPGAPTEVTPNDEEDIRKKIRQVSGAGYSNELIEEKYRPKTGQRSNTITGTINSEIKFVSTLGQIKSNASSSLNNVTRLTTPTILSRSSTPRVSSKKSSEAYSSTSRCSSRISTASESEPEPVVETASAMPLPLSVMLKNAKKDVKRKALERPVRSVEDNRNLDKKEEAKENVEMNDVWWSGTSSVIEPLNSWRRRDVDRPNRFFDCNGGGREHFDIRSTEDFPALK